MLYSHFCRSRDFHSFYKALFQHGMHNVSAIAAFELIRADIGNWIEKTVLIAQDDVTQTVALSHMALLPSVQQFHRLQLVDNHIGVLPNASEGDEELVLRRLASFGEGSICLPGTRLRGNIALSCIHAQLSTIAPNPCHEGRARSPAASDKPWDQ